MTIEVAKDIVRFLHKSKPKSVGFTFFGGEPMLEWDTIIVPLVEWSENKFPTHYNMTTNGTLFSNDRLNYIFSKNITFLLSMDGGKETQDNNRPTKNGSSSYDLIEKYIPIILKNRPRQVVRMTITKSSGKHFFEDILALINLGFINISALPNFFEPWDESDKELFLRSLTKYEEYVISEYIKGNSPVMFFGYKESFHIIWQVINAKSLGKYRSDPECAKKNQCGFGIRGGASIDYEGNIYGCHHVSPLSKNNNFCIGNIYEGIVEEKQRKLIDLYSADKIKGSNCDMCPINLVCNGGCKPNNYQITGDMCKVPDMYCFWMQSVVLSAYRIACKLGELKNLAFKNDFSLYI